MGKRQGMVGQSSSGQIRQNKRLSMSAQAPLMFMDQSVKGKDMSGHESPENLFSKEKRLATFAEVRRREHQMVWPLCPERETVNGCLPHQMLVSSDTGLHGEQCSVHQRQIDPTSSNYRSHSTVRVSPKQNRNTMLNETAYQGSSQIFEQPEPFLGYSSSRWTGSGCVMPQIFNSTNGKEAHCQGFQYNTGHNETVGALPKQKHSLPVTVSIHKDAKKANQPNTMHCHNSILSKQAENQETVCRFKTKSQDSVPLNSCKLPRKDLVMVKSPRVLYRKSNKIVLPKQALTRVQTHRSKLNTRTYSVNNTVKQLHNIEMLEPVSVQNEKTANHPNMLHHDLPVSKSVPPKPAVKRVKNPGIKSKVDTSINTVNCTSDKILPVQLSIQNDTIMTNQRSMLKPNLSKSVLPSTAIKHVKKPNFKSKEGALVNTDKHANNKVLPVSVSTQNETVANLSNVLHPNLFKSVSPKPAAKRVKKNSIKPKVGTSVNTSKSDKVLPVLIQKNTITSKSPSVLLSDFLKSVPPKTTIKQVKKLKVNSKEGASVNTGKHASNKVLPVSMQIGTMANLPNPDLFKSVPPKRTNKRVKKSKVKSKEGTSVNTGQCASDEVLPVLIQKDMTINRPSVLHPDLFQSVPPKRNIKGVKKSKVKSKEGASVNTGNHARGKVLPVPVSMQEDTILINVPMLFPDSSKSVSPKQPVKQIKTGRTKEVNIEKLASDVSYSKTRNGLPSEECQLGDVHSGFPVLEPSPGVIEYVSTRDEIDPVPFVIQPLTCLVCLLSFHDFNQYMRHKWSHNSVRRRSSRYRKQCIKTKKQLGYVLIRQNTRPFMCEFCGKNFVRRRDVTVHLRVHTGEKPYVCNLCGKGFSQNSQLKRHLISHAGEKPFSCDICGNRYSRKDGLKRHMVTHSGLRPYECHLCGSTFTYSSTLGEHMAQHRGDRPHKCNFCPQTFIKKVRLVEHERIHTGYKPFICDICNSGFTAARLLNSHKKIHAETRPFSCNVCNKGFTQRGAMTKHMVCHSNAKPWKCEECGKGFGQQQYLKNHMKIHCEDKPYKCSHCGWGFRDKTSHIRHERLHTGVRPYKCNRCDKSFNRSNHLKRHLLCHEKYAAKRIAIQERAIAKIKKEPLE